MKGKAYVYHPRHGKKLVACDDVESHLDNGWSDSPAGMDVEVAAEAESTVLPVPNPDDFEVGQEVDVLGTVYVVDDVTENGLVVSQRVDGDPASSTAVDDQHNPDPDAPKSNHDSELANSELLRRFVEDAESLEKPELLALGAELQLKLLAAWKEETLRNKIQEAIDNGDD